MDEKCYKCRKSLGEDDLKYEDDGEIYCHDCFMIYFIHE